VLQGLRQQSLERRVGLRERRVGGTRQHLAARGELEEVGTAVGRVRQAADETALDQPLDVVAQRRRRHAGRGGDRCRRHGLVVADVRDEPQLRGCDPGRLEVSLEDPHDVLGRRRDLEEKPVVALHGRTLADSAFSQ
jgi:hypothetical protein